MKKLLVPAVLLFSISAFAQQSFSIKGQIRKLDDQKIYLERTIGKMQQVLTDSCISKSGSFKFIGTVPPEDIMKAIVRNADGSFRVKFVLEPGTINFNGAADSTGWIFARGTTSNDSYYKYIQDGSDLSAEYGEIMAKIRKAKKTIDSVNIDKYIKELRANEVAGQERSIAFIKSHPTDINSVFQTMDLTYTMKVDQLEALYKPLSENVKKSFVGRMVKDKIAAMKIISVGAIAPEFIMPDTNGNIVSLSSFRGKIVLVDFWASWCGPCRGENPNLLAAYNKYAGKGLKVLAVSLDTNEGKWKKAIEEDAMPWTQISDLQGFSSNAARLYGVSAIPMNYLIDKNGKIIAKNLRGEKLQEFLEKVQW
ncbi:AhpC/TSA family protein [Chitinophaga silvatica]|uniref:AhpC/TSA family protein n=1 Tax=Chitinophaga silvatica TaxID=2282649 RepID=A0A3E1Y5I9_9BACT|nr:TlpA disulfide reductase family protein [Chitinophaga silvatica]RFS19996.1 AhpC/TSA family protein [Chitinophaga silvatica]